MQHNLGRIIEVLVDKQTIDKLYTEGKIECPELTDKPAVNSYMVIRSYEDAKQSALCRYSSNNRLIRLGAKNTISFSGISPKDSKQTAFFDSLLNREISLSTVIGPAGTGKSTLALAYALQSFFDEKKPILLTKPAVIVGANKAFGAVPGTIAEKYAPYLDSYKIILQKMLGDNAKSYLDISHEKSLIQYVPIAFVRGCTFENCSFIIDEAQNMSWHELKSTVSRMGQGTTLIILGDLDQIDINISAEQTGLYKFITSKAYSESDFTSNIYLTEQYRSKITKLVADVDTELRGVNEQPTQARRNRGVT